jgi:tetratricopeptide (TPR) repeat protein
MNLSPSLQATMFRSLKQYLVPISIAGLMIGATFLPWVIDVLGARYSAWNLPVDIGWQFHIVPFNYGALCMLCAAPVLYRVLKHWRLRYDVYAQSQHRVITAPIGWLCLFPVLLLVFQYLFADVYGIDVLAQHEIQMLLIQQRFGYPVLNQLLVLIPFNSLTSTSYFYYGATVVSGTTLTGRLLLLIDVLGPGILLPIAAGIIAFVSSNYHRVPAQTAPSTMPLRQRMRERWPICLLASLFLLIVFGRAPLAMLCEYQAKQALAMGNYRDAISWLQRAATLNPALTKIAAYHIERGRADYYLQPDHLTDDAYIYLASVYSRENDYRDAFSALQLVWDDHASHENMPWLTEQLSMTLEWLAESTATMATKQSGSWLANNNATLQQSGSWPANNNTALQQSGSWPANNNTALQQGASNSGLPQASSQLALLSTLQNSNPTQQIAATYALAPLVPGNDGSPAAMFWLSMLSQVDSSNVYASYALGRAFYAQGGYAACIEYMRQVLDANPNTNVQSSADTYIALSMIEQGKVAQARQLLLQAVQLDPDFNNNTAREQLSGLH